VIDDRVDDAVDGIRIRGATSSLVLGNTVVDARSHGVKVDGRGSADAAGTVIEHNSLSGHGPSPTSLKVARKLIRVDDNTGAWDYPWRHDLARALGWFVGPLFWALLFLVIFAGRLIIGGSRWRQKRLRPAPETQREA